MANGSLAHWHTWVQLSELCIDCCDMINFAKICNGINMSGANEFIRDTFGNWPGIIWILMNNNRLRCLDCKAYLCNVSVFPLPLSHSYVYMHTYIERERERERAHEYIILFFNFDFLSILIDRHPEEHTNTSFCSSTLIFINLRDRYPEEHTNTSFCSSNLSFYNLETPSPGRPHIYIYIYI